MTFHFSVLWSQLDRFGFDFTVEKNPLNQKDVQWILMRFSLCPNRIFKTSRLQDSYQWQFSGGRIRGIRSCGDWSSFETGVARHHCPDHLKGQALSPPDVGQEIPSEVRTRQCIFYLWRFAGTRVVPGRFINRLLVVRKMSTRRSTPTCGRFFTRRPKRFSLPTTISCKSHWYDSFSDVPESWVWLRADFQSGSRVLKKVFWTFSHLYLWHTAMWFHAEKLLKNLKFWKSLNLLYKSGSRPQKSTKIPQKTLHSIVICSIS